MESALLPTNFRYEDSTERLPGPQDRARRRALGDWKPSRVLARAGQEATLAVEGRAVPGSTKPSGGTSLTLALAILSSMRSLETEWTELGRDFY